jgi:uncharacterized phiE125 gp8 family phage protein
MICAPHWAVRVTDEGNDDDVLTVDELKERARIVPGDEESDALLQSYITAARQQVERDIGCALPTQTVAASFDTVDASQPLTVPWPPLQAVEGVSYTDPDGVVVDLDPTELITRIDTLSMPGRIWWLPGVFTGVPYPLTLTLALTVGWTKDTLPPLLKFAVGLLAAHYLTAGRDRVVIGTIVDDMPAGYAEAIQAYRIEVLV